MAQSNPQEDSLPVLESRVAAVEERLSELDESCWPDGHPRGPRKAPHEADMYKVIQDLRVEYAKMWVEKSAENEQLKVALARYVARDKARYRANQISTELLFKGNTGG